MSQSGNDVVNWYKKVKKHNLDNHENPHYEKHGLSLPFRAIIVGASGSMKTNTLISFLALSSGTFGKVILCVKSVDEPLYRQLLETTDPDVIEVFEDGKVPDVRDYKDEKEQMLVVFDDLVTLSKKEQKPIEEWYIRGRKIAGGCSLMYLTQSFYAVPKTIRLQCNYLFLKKLSSTSDLNLILRDFTLGVSKDILYKLYKYATSEQTSFMLISIQDPPEKRFRKNWKDYSLSNVLL